MNPLFVGIDVSSKSNVVCLMKPDGAKHSSFSVQNNLGGAKLLSKKIVSALEETQLSQLVIGMEATSVYGDNLMRFLREDAATARFERKLHMLNPKQVKKFKEAYSDLPKNDYIDAFIIADNLRFGRTTREVTALQDYRYEALKSLTRARFFAVQSLTREKQRFLNNVFLKFSSLTQEEVFSNTFGTTSLTILEAFDTIDDLANASLDDLICLIRTKGHGKFSDPEATAKALQAAARSSYRLPKTINDSVNQVLAVSISTMRAMDVQIKTLDKAVAEQLAIIPNTLTSVKGIGPVYAAGLLAEIGDVNRFDSQASLAKYAGLVWNQHQSGDFEAQTTRLIKSGNRFLRYYLLEAANSLRRCDAEFKRYYDLKYREVNKFQHKRALALTARKLVRLVFRLLKDNRLYIPPEQL
jgi:transposase